MKLFIFVIMLAFSCNENGEFQYVNPETEVDLSAGDAESGNQDGTDEDILEDDGVALPPSAGLKAFLEKHGLTLDHALDDYTNVWDKKDQEWSRENGVANPRMTTTFTFNFSKKALTGTVTLAKDIGQSPGEVEIGRQVTRMQRTFEKNQPGALAASTDNDINQNQLGILDILLVIDSSGSMSNEQTQMMNNLKSLPEPNC